ncbi:MAG: ATP-dependent metalloprotease, partial [Marinomonas gallaica]
EEDKYSLSKRGIESQICSLYGGRIAEEMIHGFDGVSTGASNDIERASSLARNMVTKWGLSAELGAFAYEEDDQQSMTGSKNNYFSPETGKKLDSEVRGIIDRCYQKSTQILEENREKLEVMADALMVYETIDANQIKEIMDGKKPSPPAGWSDPSAGSDVSGGGAAEAGGTTEAAPNDPANSDQMTDSSDSTDETPVSQKPTGEA